MPMKSAVLHRLQLAVGGESLGRGYYTFLLVHTSFLVFTRLPGVFINTLLLGESNDLGVVMMYNMAFFVSGAVCMLIAARVMHKTSAGFVAITGIMIYNLLYLALVIILLSGHAASDYHIALGVVMGAADGFYWLAYGNLLADNTGFQNRDRGLAILCVFDSAVNLVVPLFAGWVISAVGSVGGYLAVFAMAFAISIGTSAPALRLPRDRRSAGGSTEYSAVLRVVRRRKPLRYSLLAQGCKGIREGVFTFIFSIVIYQLIKSEFLVGVNTFAAALVSILSFLVMGKTITQKNRVAVMTLAAAVLVAAAAADMIWINVGMIFLFTVLNAFFSGFIVNSCYTNFLDMLQKYPELDARQPEMIALNECYLVAGRIVGIAILVVMTRLFGDSLTMQMTGLLVLSLTQFATAALCRASERALTNTSAGV